MSHNILIRIALVLMFSFLVAACNDDDPAEETEEVIEEPDEEEEEVITALNETHYQVIVSAVEGLVSRGLLPSVGGLVISDRTTLGEIADFLVNEDGMNLVEALDHMFPFETLAWHSLEEADLAFEGYLQANLEAEDIDADALSELNRPVQTWMYESYTAHFEELGPFEGWDQFYVQFPDASGYYRFSKPVIFEHSGFALAHIDLVCGWFCGGGYYVLLRKQDDEWQFADYFSDWTI